MMRLHLWLTIGLMALLPVPALAAKYALVIGNSAYEELEPLPNTIADAEAYKAAFEELGYEAEYLTDLDLEGMWAALDQLTNRIEPGDDVAFVFSGHGWSDGQVNYLIPTDAVLSPTDKQLRRASIPLRDAHSGILDEIERAGAKLTLAIIDACRNNPFLPPEGTRSSAMTRGMAPVSVPRGTFVIFSAGTGQLALDSLASDAPDQRLSVFTRTFLPRLTGGDYLEDAIAHAQVETAELALSENGHLQHPAYYDQTLGKTCLFDQCGAPAPAAETPPQAEVPPVSETPVPEPEPQQLAAAILPETTVQSKAVRSPSVAQCDLFGANPWHPDIQAGRAEGAGTEWDDLEGTLAEHYCRAALKESPDNPRLLAALGRALRKQGKFNEAHALLLQAAGAGDPDAELSLAYMAYSGEAIARDRAEAAERAKRASDEGHIEASVMLALFYEQGSGVAPDPDRSIGLQRRAADQGHPFALKKLGDFYADGIGVEVDLPRAAKLYGEAAGKGNVEAMTALAAAYRSGRGVEQDIDRAVELYTEAAEGKDATAIYMLGYLHWHGEGVERDIARAADLYADAAQRGNVDAIFELGHVYYGGEGVPQDRKRAVALFQEAADKGNAAAIVTLAVVYFRGEDVARDFPKASELFLEAAAKGEARALPWLHYLGETFRSGEETEQDPKRAADLFRAASELGHAPSLDALEALYVDGLAEATDYARTIELFRASSEDGEALALRKLANMHALGLGVPSDPARAEDFIRAVDALSLGAEPTSD